jgi:hypothetical protein
MNLNELQFVLVFTLDSNDFNSILTVKINYWTERKRKRSEKIQLRNFVFRFQFTENSAFLYIPLKQACQTGGPIARLWRPAKMFLNMYNA